MRVASYVLLLCLAACTTPTQVIVGFEGERQVMERATDFRVRLYREGETSAFYDETRVTSEFVFPARIPVLPMDEDATRRFRVLGELSDGGGVFSTVRAETGFVAGALRYVWLRFDDSCIDMDCGPQWSCRDGACMGACVTPAEEDVRPAPSGLCIGAMDGAVDDGGASDVGADDVGVRDAGPTDAGPTDSSQPSDGGPDSGPDCGCDCDDRCVDGECVPTVPVQSVALGALHTCAVTTRGLFCWGANNAGQLGMGDMEARIEPVLVPETSEVAEVSLGDGFSLYRTVSGAIFSFGDNANRRLGLGTDPAEPILVPTPIGMGTYRSIDAGDEHACAITTDRNPVCWGLNRNGRADPATPVLSINPRQAGFGDDWDSVSAATNHTCGVRASGGGRIVCWGSQNAGRLGNDETSGDSMALVSVRGGVTYSSVAAGADHTCGLSQASEIFCFGSDVAGQLGNGNRGSRSLPFAIADDGPTTWSQVSAGRDHTCAIRDGVLHCWGSNFDKQLGLPDVSGNIQVPMALPGAWLSVVAGQGVTCGINDRSALYCWGDNAGGRLGVGDTSERASPARVCIPSE